MQTANILLSLGGDTGNQVMKWRVTAAEIAVLRAIHGDESVTEVEPHDDVQRSHRDERARLLNIYGGAKTAEQKPVVEGMFPGIAARVFEKLHELDMPESFFKATGRLKAEPAPVDPDSGPTVAEWVAAGYRASNYPPSGYASKSTPEEIAAAVAAEKPAAAPWKPAVLMETDPNGPDAPAFDAEDDGVGDDINDEHAEKDNVLG